MFMKKTAALIVAGVLIFGVAGSTALAQDQTRDQLRDETGNGVPDQIRAHDQLKDGTGGGDALQAMDKTQTQTHTQYRLKDGSGDGVRDQIRDRVHDRADAGSGSMGGGMRGMRGSRR